MTAPVADLVLAVAVEDDLAAAAALDVGAFVADLALPGLDGECQIRSHCLVCPREIERSGIFDSICLGMNAPIFVSAGRRCGQSKIQRAPKSISDTLLRTRLECQTNGAIA